jgi:hypothetical protein
VSLVLSHIYPIILIFILIRPKIIISYTPSVPISSFISIYPIKILYSFLIYSCLLIPRLSLILWPYNICSTNRIRNFSSWNVIHPFTSSHLFPHIVLSTCSQSHPVPRDSRREATTALHWMVGRMSEFAVALSPIWFIEGERDTM